MKIPLLLMLSLAFALPVSTSFAADDKTVKAERHKAQKLRQQQKNDSEIRDASNSFREFARDLKMEYQEKTRDLDTEFRLQQVDMNAERDAKIAVTEVEIQQKISQLMLNPDQSNNEAAVEQLKSDMKTYSDQIFEIKKQAAMEKHREFIDNELKKHQLLNERDETALAMASDLGLRSQYEPILATPIGDGLTKQEKNWNEREKKEVVRLFKSNQRLLGEFLYGKKLRHSEIENKRTDFDLEWQKKSELQALKLEQTYYNSFLMQAASGAEFDQQAYTKRISELQKQNQLINIKYKKIRDKNRIRRMEERRKIVTPAAWYDCLQEVLTRTILD